MTLCPFQTAALRSVLPYQLRILKPPCRIGFNARATFLKTPIWCWRRTKSRGNFSPPLGFYSSRRSGTLRGKKPKRASATVGFWPEGESKQPLIQLRRLIFSDLERVTEVASELQ